MQLFDRMVDRDDRLQGVLETRKLAVTGVDRKVLPGLADDDRAIAAADLVEAQIANIDFDDALSALLDGVPKGISVLEIIWEGSTVVALNEVPQRMLRWDEGVLMVATGTGRSTDYKPLDANKYVVFHARSKPGPKEKAGLLRSLSILWVAKHWALRDWASFVEVFGMPMRLGIYPKGTTDEQKAVLYEALQDLGADTAAIIPEAMRIEFPRAQNTGAVGSETPMEQLISYSDVSYAIRVLGQNLTTQSESGSGTLAGGAHENVRSDYKKSDAKKSAAALKRDLFRPIVGFNLGWDYPTPNLWFDVEDAQDDEARMKVYTEGAKIPGMTFSKAQIREEFALREPLDEDDEVGGIDEAETPEFEEFAARLRNATKDVILSDRVGEKLLDTYATPVPGTPKADMDLSRTTLSSGMRANERVAQDAHDQVADDHIQLITDFVLRLAGEVDTPEQLLRRIKLAAPDLEGDLEASGLALDDVVDVTARTYMSGAWNGDATVANELEVQAEEEGLDT
jgi:phage gp29-like protein